MNYTELNTENLAGFRKSIDNLRLSDKKNTTKNLYKSFFYEHLNSIVALGLIIIKDTGTFEIENLDERVYHSFEQYVLENSAIIENEIPENVDDDFVYDTRKILKNRLKTSLSPFSDKADVLPFIKDTANGFENWLTYKLMHPNTKLNPWEGIMKIVFNNGCVINVSDEKDFVKSYYGEIYEKVDDDEKDNIVVMAKGTGKVNATLVDNRYSIQTYVLDYLKKNASGVQNLKTKSNILNHIASNYGKDLKSYVLDKNVLLPLKREGLIGSNTNGMFYIENVSDLDASYQHHLTKLKGIIYTMDRQKNRAIDMGVNDIQKFNQHNDLSF